MRFVKISGSDFERGIKIQGSHIVKRLSIEHTYVSSNSINIEKSEIATIDFAHIKLVGTGLSIVNSSISNRLRFTSINTDSSLSFIKSKFLKDVYIWGGNAKGITFNDGEYEDYVRIEAVKNNGTLTVFGDNFKKSLQVDYEDKASAVSGGHEGIYLNGSKFSGGLIVNGSDHLTQRLEVKCSLELSGTLYFNSCLFNHVELNSDNHKANFIFNYASFGKITFYHFSNYGNLILSSCKSLLSVPDSEIIVYNSNLGKAQFQNFFFNSFKKVSIIDSLVSNIEFSGMHWFKPDVLDVGDTSSPHRRSREIYRQLKHASEKQNDKFQALEFQAQELSSFRKQVLSTGKLLSNDGLILWLGQTNDYGLNWGKPIWLLLFVSTLLYFPFIISASNKLTWAPACNYNDLKVTIGEFLNYSYMWPQLFNPARTLRHAFHEGVYLGLGVYFWDMIQRIVLAFFIVQIVSAFRKYFKS